MLTLGQARQALHQKERPWTPEKNRRMMINMGLDVHGNVSATRFVAYFEARLERDPDTFRGTMQRFAACAEHLRGEKAIPGAVDERGTFVEQVSAAAGYTVRHI